LAHNKLLEFIAGGRCCSTCFRNIQISEELPVLQVQNMNSVASWGRRNWFTPWNDVAQSPYCQWRAQLSS